MSPSPRHALLGVLTLLAALASTAALAWACNPQAHIVLDKGTYEAASTITVNGSYFPGDATVTVDGPVDAKVVQTSALGGFRTQLTAPSVPGHYTITASRPTGGFAPASFSVVAASTPPVTPPTEGQPTVPSPVLAPDLVGPEIVRPTRPNEAVSVAPNGSFTLFCARLEESDVTGTCGLVSRRSSRLGQGPLLAIAAKSFRAQAGQRVAVRFYLSPSKLRRLKQAVRLRMRASVAATDLLGYRSALTFGVTLKAPRQNRSP